MDMLQGNRLVALKKIKVDGEMGSVTSSTLREITLLMQLEHPNVVKLENVVMERERFGTSKFQVLHFFIENFHLIKCLNKYFLIVTRMCLIFELSDTDLKKYIDLVKGDLLPNLIQVLLHIQISFYSCLALKLCILALYCSVIGRACLLPFDGSHS